MSSQLTHFCSVSLPQWHWPSPPEMTWWAGVKEMQETLWRNARLHCTGFAQQMCDMGHGLGWNSCSTGWLYFIIYVTTCSVSRKQKGRCLMLDTQVEIWVFFVCCLVWFGFFLTLKSYLQIRLDCKSCKVSNLSVRNRPASHQTEKQ